MPVAGLNRVERNRKQAISGKTRKPITFDGDLPTHEEDQVEGTSINAQAQQRAQRGGSPAYDAPPARPASW